MARSKWCLNVGPLSSTLSQHRNSAGQALASLCIYCHLADIEHFTNWNKYSLLVLRNLVVRFCVAISSFPMANNFFTNAVFLYLLHHIMNRYFKAGVNNKNNLFWTCSHSNCSSVSIVRSKWEIDNERCRLHNDGNILGVNIVKQYLLIVGCLVWPSGHFSIFWLYIFNIYYIWIRECNPGFNNFFNLKRNIGLINLTT